MLSIPRNRSTVDCLQELLDDVFHARDELYAAARRLIDEDQRTICGRLADRLGGQAATLQQVVTASGVTPVAPSSNSSAEATFESIQTEDGDVGVLSAAQRTQETLLARYDFAIEQLDDREIRGLLNQQRRESEFADCVLRSLTHSMQLSRSVHF